MLKQPVRNYSASTNIRSRRLVNPDPKFATQPQEALKRGLSKKELLYACLQSGGVEIPDAEEIDGRRR